MVNISLIGARILISEAPRGKHKKSSVLFYDTVIWHRFSGC